MLVAACSLGISVHWVGHRPTSTSGYKMKLHVFVDVIVVGGGGGEGAVWRLCMSTLMSPQSLIITMGCSATCVPMCTR